MDSIQIEAAIAHEAAHAAVAEHLGWKVIQVEMGGGLGFVGFNFNGTPYCERDDLLITLAGRVGEKVSGVYDRQGVAFEWSEDDYDSALDTIEYGDEEDLAAVGDIGSAVSLLREMEQGLPELREASDEVEALLNGDLAASWQGWKEFIAGLSDGTWKRNIYGHWMKTSEDFTAHNDM